MVMYTAMDFWKRTVLSNWNRQKLIDGQVVLLNVKITIHSHIKNCINFEGDSVSMEIEKPCSVEELALRIGIPSKEIGFYCIDQKIKPKDTLVNDGDTIEFYPHIEGG